MRSYPVKYEKSYPKIPGFYEQTDAKPVLISRNYTAIPHSASLKQYSPIPESQGSYGTCVGWATAFAARTISESVALTRTSQVQNSNNVFSPIYVYKNISNDLSGKSGIRTADALDLMKNHVFSNSGGLPGTISERVPPVKKSIAERKPVIIAMKTPSSFLAGLYDMPCRI